MRPIERTLLYIVVLSEILYINHRQRKNKKKSILFHHSTLVCPLTTNFSHIFTRNHNEIIVIFMVMEGVTNNYVTLFLIFSPIKKKNKLNQFHFIHPPHSFNDTLHRNSKKLYHLNEFRFENLIASSDQRIIFFFKNS